MRVGTYARVSTEGQADRTPSAPSSTPDAEPSAKREPSGPGSTSTTGTRGPDWTVPVSTPCATPPKPASSTKCGV